MYGRGNRKYPVPFTLGKLKVINNLLIEHNYSDIESIFSIDIDFELLNQEAEFAYNNHPIDVIPFALTAFAGEHFGFLTDFGTVQDLDNACIVYVQALPSEEFHVTLIASNLREFLGLLLSNPDWISYIFDETIEVDLSSRSDPNYSYLNRLLNEHLDIRPISLNKYRENLKEMRLNRIVVQTRNGIGITRISSENIGSILIVDPEKEYEDIFEEVREYFEHASIENKLASIVDLQESGVLTTYTSELNEYLIKELKEMGFFYESKMLELTTKDYE